MQVPPIARPKGSALFPQDKLRLDERRFRSPFSSTDRNGAALLALNDELAAKQADAVGRTGRKGEAALAALATARAEGVEAPRIVDLADEAAELG